MCHFLLLPGESHGQRSLAGYSPRGHTESDTAERLTLLCARRWSGPWEYGGEQMAWVPASQSPHPLPWDLLYVSLLAPSVWGAGHPTETSGPHPDRTLLGGEAAVLDSGVCMPSCYPGPDCILQTHLGGQWWLTEPPTLPASLFHVLHNEMTVAGMGIWSRRCSSESGTSFQQMSVIVSLAESAL